MQRWATDHGVLGAINESAMNNSSANSVGRREFDVGGHLELTVSGPVLGALKVDQAMSRTRQVVLAHAQE